MRIVLYFIPLLLLGCSWGNSKNNNQSLCDSINAQWPVVTNNRIELTKVHCTDKSYTVYVTLLKDCPMNTVNIEWGNKHFYYDEEDAMNSYEPPYSCFIRELRETEKTFDDVISLLSDDLWIDMGSESTQGHLPLYVVIKDEKCPNDSVEVKYDYTWI